MKDTTILLNTRTPKDEGKYIRFDAKIDDEGGSSLPSVTSADAGKVLAVNDSGEWAAEQKIFHLLYNGD